MDCCHRNCGVLAPSVHLQLRVEAHTAFPDSTVPRLSMPLCKQLNPGPIMSSNGPHALSPGLLTLLPQISKEMVRSSSPLIVPQQWKCLDQLSNLASRLLWRLRWTVSLNLTLYKQLDSHPFISQTCMWKLKGHVPGIGVAVHVLEPASTP